METKITVDEFIKKTTGELAEFELNLEDDQNFRDGSRPDVNQLRELRESASKIVSKIQKKIDDVINEANGWDDYVGSYVKITTEVGHITYMHVESIQRLFRGCRFIGGVFCIDEDDVIFRTNYEYDIDKNMVEVITKDEFHNGINCGIAKVKKKYSSM